VNGATAYAGREGVNYCLTRGGASSGQAGVARFQHTGGESPATRGEQIETLFAQHHPVWHFSPMSVLAESIDQRLHSLPAPQARKLERLLLQLLDLFNVNETSPEGKQAVQRYQLPTRDLQVRQGLDLTKLAHFDEDERDS
jgi:hypothetical protein